MEVSGKLHAPVANPREIPTPEYPLDEGGWTPEPVWTWWQREK